jgi:outer membrane lipase/esterase
MPASPPAAAGRVQAVTGQFTTNPGWVWSQQVADYYGTNASPTATARTATTAVGGAAWRWTTGALGAIPSLKSQAAVIWRQRRQG